MKSILRIALALTLIFTLTTGCKKYVDGPAFSLLTKKSRLCGDWKIQTVTVNGTDVTAITTALLGANYTVDIEKDGKYRIFGAVADDGTWKFGEDKDDVYFTSSKAGSVEQAYRILRLKSKELWLRQTASNGDQTIVKYVPSN